MQVPGRHRQSKSVAVPAMQDVRLVHKMIVGSGIDLVEIERIQQSRERYGARFLNRIFTAAEQAYCLRKRNAAESLAARFAAKEAGAKALGTGISHGVNWLEIEVVREPGGRPSIRFHGRAAQIAEHMGVARTALSLTHTADLAMASVLLEDSRAD
jgi:holo-[acyl-carrier protein] synthase